MRWLLPLLCALLAAPLSADELRPAVIEMSERGQGQWTLEWKLPIAVSARGTLPVIADPVVPAGCDFINPPVRRAAPLALVGHAQLRCEADLAGQQLGLSELIGNADAIARLVPIDAPSQTFRLTASAPTATIAVQPSRWQVLRDYFVIGAEHIIFGWDHLLFVIALVLLVRQPWPVVKAATAFTIAHSITLVATVLGYSGLPGRPVEALIALSIVFLAVEVMVVLRDRERYTLTRRFPWAVAFAFGLVHGFGFAGALADIGLPQTQLATALFAFNIGVEAGQLLIVAVTLFALHWLYQTADKVEKSVLKFATYGIGIIGSYWLIERVIG